MALKCRGEYLMDGVYTRINTRQIMATSQLVTVKTVYIYTQKRKRGTCYIVFWPL